MRSIWMSIVVIKIPPKNVTMIRVAFCSGFARGMFVGWESDLVDSFEECKFRDDSVLYNDGIAYLKKTPSLRSSTPRGNDLKYCLLSLVLRGLIILRPLASDEIESDKRWEL
ncbi:hypothetical protein Tco_0999505 [Tanacetum coccineum]